VPPCAKVIVACSTEAGDIRSITAGRVHHDPLATASGERSRWVRDRRWKI